MKLSNKCINYFSTDEANNVAMIWYRHGLENNNDTFVKFVMHWFAFNWLYDTNDYNQNTESGQIVNFCRRNIEKLKKYNAFETEKIKVFLDSPVRSMRRTKNFDNNNCQNHQICRTDRNYDIINSESSTEKNNKFNHDYLSGSL